MSDFEAYVKAQEDKVINSLKRKAFEAFIADKLLEIAEAYSEVFPEGERLHLNIYMDDCHMSAFDDGDLYFYQKI